MKLFYFSGLVLVLLSIYGLQLANSEEVGSEADEAAKTAAPDAQANPTPANEQPAQNNPNPDADDTDKSEEDKDIPTAKPEVSNNETEAEGDKNPDTKENTDTGPETDTKDEELENLIVKDDCKATIKSCLSALKDKPTLDKVACDEVKKGKSCFTNGTDGKQCSDDEFDKVEDAVCFCPRSVPSLLLVGIFCILAKLLVHQ